MTRKAVTRRNAIALSMTAIGTCGLALDALSQPIGAVEGAQNLFSRGDDPRPVLVVSPAALDALHAARPSQGGAAQDEIAAEMGRKLVKLPSLRTLVPQTMTVLNPKPGEPDLFATQDRDVLLSFFEGSLEPRQWELLGSEQGIGLGDLSDQQRRLFERLLPRPFLVERSVIRSAGDEPEVIGTHEVRDLGEIRLQMVITPDIHLLTNSSRSLSVDSRGLRKEKSEFNRVRHAADHVPQPDAYGVVLKHAVPNTLKAGQLNLRAEPFRAEIVVGQSGEETVETLLRRVGKAVNMDLTADDRLRRLPIAIWGQNSIRCSDLLHALCLSVTGAFRKVGTTFLLTDDVEGLGARLERIQEWLESASQQRAQLEDSLRDAIGHTQPLRYLTFARSDSLTIDAATKQKIVDAWKRGEHGVEVQSTFFDPEVQLGLQNIAAQKSAGPNQLRTDAMRLDAAPRLVYLVPGIGPVEDDSLYLGSLGSLLPRPPKTEAPLSVQFHEPLTALVNARSPEHAAGIVRSAEQSGFRNLWILPQSDRAQEILQAAVDEGRRIRSACSIVGAVRALSVEHDSIADLGAPGGISAFADLNIWGETSRRAVKGAARSQAPLWLSPAYGSAIQFASTQVNRLGAVDGLAGVVVLDCAGPGYRNGALKGFDDVGPRPGEDFGFTLKQRLTFLQTNGVDPIDIARPITRSARHAALLSVDLSLPLFPETKPPAISDSPAPPGRDSLFGRWQEQRLELTNSLLGTLTKSIWRLRPRASIFVEAGPFRSYLPVAMEESASVQIQPAKPLFHLEAPPSFWKNFSGGKQPTSAGSAPGLLAQLKRYQADSWAGVVLDLRSDSEEPVFPKISLLNGGL